LLTELPPYLVLLRVGFALPAPLLERRCALTAPFHPYLGVVVRALSSLQSLHNDAAAVCFLWHFPSSAPSCKSLGTLPDVIRHTALRSSDFPLLAPKRGKRPSGPAAYKPIIYALPRRTLHRHAAVAAALSAHL